MQQRALHRKSAALRQGCSSSSKSFSSSRAKRHRETYMGQQHHCRQEEQLLGAKQGKVHEVHMGKLQVLLAPCLCFS